MPRVIDLGEDAVACSLEECVDALALSGFDPGDGESLAHGAGWLARLGSNREFLADHLLQGLRASFGKETTASAYSPQSIVLSPMRGTHFLRANIWPAEQDRILRASGARSFAYGVPHDHNFDFLTLGYLGPGYESDYYEFDYDRVVGEAGERVPLRFVERSRLSPGRMLLYRAHRDIHRQLPPESLSVSLNIMHIDPAAAWFDQYRFDLEESRVAGVLNPTSTEVFLRIAVGLGSQEAQGLAADFGRSHPSDRLRLASYEARAAVAPDEQARDALWREAERGGSRLLSAEARRRRQALGG